jgi:hypothetical protein
MDFRPRYISLDHATTTIDTTIKKQDLKRFVAHMKIITEKKCIKA